MVLLFKMRSKADRDQHDVETALPVLNAEQRSWLEDTLRLLPRGKTAPLPEAASVEVVYEKPPRDL